MYSEVARENFRFNFVGAKSLFDLRIENGDFDIVIYQFFSELALYINCILNVRISV